MGNNSIRFTKEQLKNTACAPLNQWIFEPLPKSKGISISNKRGQKIKGWIGMQLYAYCKANKLFLVCELKFHPEHKYSFDWAILYGVTKEQIEQKTWKKENQVCAIEYEGLMSEKSGHTTVTGYTSNTNKYNDAALLGWPLIRVTVLNYKTLFNTVIPTVQNYFSSPQNK